MARRTVAVGAGIVFSCLHFAARAGQPLDAPAFSLRIPTQSTPAATAPPAASRPDALQIERLLAGQQMKPAPLAAQTNADAAGEISDCVRENILTVDPGNPTWNDQDPRWEAMRQTIARDCAARREYRAKVIEPQLQRMYRDALANSYVHHLSHEDADALIAFYATETGRRFLAFQARLTAIEFGAMRQAKAHSDGPGGASTPGAAPPPAPPAPDVMRRRTALLLLSRQILLMLQWQGKAAQTDGDESAGAIAVAPMMMSLTATLEGGAVDQVQKEFAPDLPAFSAFLSSPAEKNEIRAQADAQWSFGKASATQLIKLAPQWNGDLQKWREQYRKLPSPGASAPAARPH